MHVLVAYATKHGSTGGIAERIASRLRDSGFDAEARPVRSVDDPARYDAFVVGAASYMFHWMKEARDFARRHRRVLAAHPVWTFSSGPVGPDLVDERGQDVLAACLPREMPDIDRAIGSREHRVFFGAIAPDFRPKGFAERLVWMMPAARDSFPRGDFRDWNAIDAWADTIARQLGDGSAGA